LKGKYHLSESSDPATRSSMVDRFIKAAQMDANNWRDPQHDLEAIRLATPDELAAIERFLLGRGINHFIDAQALALIDSPDARQALLGAFRQGTTEIRAAIAYLAPDLIQDEERLAELIARIDTCDAYQGLSLTLEQIETSHPPSVIEAMLRRIARDSGVAAVHFAALLLYLHGLASEPFEWEQRPFFLRFNSDDPCDRRAALVELCQKIGYDESNWYKNRCGNQELGDLSGDA